MTRKPLLYLSAAGLLLGCLTLVSLVLAQSPGAVTQPGASYDLSWWTVDGGGHTFSTGADYQLGGTIGQPDAGELSGGGYMLDGGFWDEIVEASVLVVNTTDDTDDGACDAAHCSLREAITAANTMPGPDTVAFDIPPSDLGYKSGGWWTIRPSGPLPELSDDGITIDGTTQTSNRGDTNPLGPEIELDGSLVDERSQGLMVTSASNLIRGLVINRFTGLSKAISLWGQEAAGNRVLGNYLGTDPTGAEDRGNDWGIEVWLGAHDNTIGGASPAERNIISGNDQRGIAVGWESHDNLIVGNFIGTTAQGNAPLGNTSTGIIITDSPRNIVGPGNIIAYNGGGVRVSGAESLGDTITANSIYSNTEGIWLHEGGNAGLAAPVIVAVSATTAQGTACADCRVEIFSDAAVEGAVYEGFAIADATGQFIFSQPAGLTGPNITATATDAAGNTSAFSAPVARGLSRIYLPLALR
jgi:CSLREA domain-containing protein